MIEKVYKVDQRYLVIGVPDVAGAPKNNDVPYTFLGLTGFGPNLVIYRYIVPSNITEEEARLVEQKVINEILSMHVIE